MIERLVPNKALSVQIYEILCKQISEMCPGANKLPSEEDLAAMLGVSRTTVREALGLLLTEGVITKVQGKGNFAHPSVFHLDNRIDLHPDLYLLLAQKHKDVTLAIESIGTLPCSDSFLRYYQGAFPGLPVFVMDWSYGAGGKPMIYGRFEFPAELIKTAPPPQLALRSLTEFGEQYLKQDIAYCAMYLECGFNEKAAAQFGIAQTIPLQCWKENIYTVEDRQIGFGQFYFNPEEMVVSIITHFGKAGRP